MCVLLKHVIHNYMLVYCVQPVLHGVVLSFLPGRVGSPLASAAQAAAAGQQLQRMAVRASNQRLVAAWNAANGASADTGFRLSLNRFADWLPEEYAALMTAKRSSSRSEAVKVRVRGGGL
jgi:hypothetical protein